MNRLDYLKLAINQGLANKLEWVYSAFTKVIHNEDKWNKNIHYLCLKALQKNYQYLNEDSELITIEETDTSVPLFSFKERITVDQSWGPNIKEPVETCIGNVIFNSAVVLPSFGGKYPFEAGRLKISNYENYIATRLKNDKDKTNPDDLLVSEYLKFRDKLVYMESLAPITNWTVTRINLSKPDGIDEFRKQLIEEYGDRLNDKITFAEYEKRLREFDDNYLKQDVSYNNFVSGKIKDISRKQQFLAIGMPEALDPTDKRVPVTRTLEEGLPTDPDQYVAVLNGSRFGSFSRGSETVDGGVTAKAFNRVSSNYRVNIKDCGTTLGIKKFYGPKNINRLIGCTLIVNGKQIKVENAEQAKAYVLKEVLVRSPATCANGPGDLLCETCCTETLSQFKEGINIPLAEMSGIILTQSLKAMHGKVLSSSPIDLSIVLS